MHRHSLRKLLCLSLASTLVAGGITKTFALATDWTTLLQSSPLPSGTLNSLTAINGDDLLKGPSNTQPGIMEVGDYLTGVMDTSRIAPAFGYPGTQIGTGTAYSEVTGIFLVKITSKTAAGGGTFNFTFGSDSSKFAAQFGFTSVASGTILRLYSDANPNFTLSGSNAVSIASASDGVPYLDAGFTGAGGSAAPGQGWLMLNGSDNFGALSNQTYSTTLGTANFALDRTSLIGAGGALNLVQQTTSITSLFGGSAELIGSTTFKGSLGTGLAWTATSHTAIDFAVATSIPEPASLGLLGMGLTSLLLHRRKSA